VVLVFLLEFSILLALLLGHLQLIDIDQIIGDLFLVRFGASGRGSLAVCLFFFRESLHLEGEQFPSSACGILPSTFPSLLASINGLTLEHWSAAIEDEDGLDADEEQLADAAKEADDMTVSQGIALLVADCLEKLIDPDGRVNGETLLVQSLDLDRSSAWLHHSPEAGDTHGCG